MTFQSGPDSDQLKFLVVSLAHAPTKDALCWAENVIRWHSDRRVIVATHCYQDSTGEWHTGCGTGSGLIGSGGDVIFEELLARHSNVFLIPDRIPDRYSMLNYTGHGVCGRAWAPACSLAPTRASAWVASW